MSAPAEPRNIYIVGAQCTGKTTVVNELKRQFQSMALDLCIDVPRIISEVARTVLKKHPIETEKIRSDPGQSLNLQKLILAAQAEAEEDVLAQGSWFISDRSGFDPIVYARRYAGAEPAEEMMRSTDWLKLKERMSGALVVICEAGVEWLQDDGVRLMPEDGEDWIRFHLLFCQMLDEAGLEYYALPSAITDLSERADFVLSAWQRSKDTRTIRGQLI